MTGNLDNKEHYGTTLDNLIEGFQLIGFDWRYIYVNDAIVKQSKYKREELLGYTMMEKYPGIEKTPLFESLRECMEDHVSKTFENEFTYPDKTKRWFELRIQAVPEGIFILSIDITERKNAEKTEAKYIKGLEEMIFLTSHKVRQPIAQIIGFSNLLEGPINSQEELSKITGYMKQSIVSLDLFTKELMTFIYNLQQKAKK